MALKGGKKKKSKYDDIDEDDPYCWVKNEEYSDESSIEEEEEEEQEEIEESSEEVDTGPLPTETIDFFDGIKLKIDTRIEPLDSSDEDVKLMEKYKYHSGCISLQSEKVDFDDLGIYDKWRAHPLIVRGAYEGRRASPIEVQA